MIQSNLPKINQRGMVDLNAEIPPELDERIQRIVVSGGARHGLKKTIIILALEIGLSAIEKEQLTTKAS